MSFPIALPRLFHRLGQAVLFAGLVVAPVRVLVADAATPAPLPGAPADPVMRAERVQEASGRRGVVVAGHPQAAQAGIAVMQAGGNAIDAAVATSLALGVAEPYGSGMGGKIMMVIFRASDKALFAVDGMGQAGARLDVAAYRAMNSSARGLGGAGVALPGQPAGLDVAHREFGRLEWAQVVQPAIDLAEQGFRIEPKSLAFMGAQLRKLRANRELGRLYLPGGRLPEEGSLLPNPDLAELMRVYQRERSAGFYRGPVAETLAAGIKAAGGHLTVEDFANYEAVLTAPVVARLGAWRVAGGPPPTSGGSFLLTAYAGLLTELDRSQPLRSADNMDRFGRIVQQVYPVIQRNIADDPGALSALRRLLAPDFIDSLRSRARAAQVREPYAPVRLSWATPLIDPLAGWDQALPVAVPLLAGLPATGPGEHETCTTHFVVADGEGNVVSVTQSQSSHFGGGLVVPGTGLVLNNDMGNFSYTGRGVNAAASGKRPRSTISPTILLQGDRPVFALGVPGGQRIPTGVLQAMLDLTLLGADPADVIAAPRIHLVRSESTSGEHHVWQVEDDFPTDVSRALERKGWSVNIPQNPEFFGGITLIHLRPDGSLRGVADLRRTNWAEAW